MAYAVSELDQFWLVFRLVGHKTQLKPGPRGPDSLLPTYSSGASSQGGAAQTNITFWL